MSKKHNWDDYIGKQFGNVIIESFYIDKNDNRLFNCKCIACGYLFTIRCHTFLHKILAKGLNITCPMCKVAHYDCIGKKFGKWTVLEYAGIINKGDHAFKCRCDCGTELVIGTSRLLTGKTSGCSKCTSGKRTHLASHTSLYSIWQHMRFRCNNPNRSRYKDYGGRGIRVCKEWNEHFEPFYEWAMSHGYKKGLSIDRIDVNGNYEPNNCRWANASTQGANKRKLLANTSGYTGVSYEKAGKNRKKRWHSRIVVERKVICLGYYYTQKEALEARNNYIINNNLAHPIQKYIGELKIIENVIDIKPCKSNKSGYTGIYFDKKGKKWVGSILQLKLGRFNTQKEALEARNKYIMDNDLDYPIQEYKGEIGSVNN